MEVYRLCRKKFAAVLSGKGAALKGARWNSPRTELIYASLNRSLAIAEIAVHFSLATLPEDYLMMSIFVPDNISLQKLTVKNLPAGWNTFPAHPSAQIIGDEFVADNIYCVLQIPSAVTAGDYTLLINPAHIEFEKIKIVATERFPFDKRIFK